MAIFGISFPSNIPVRKEKKIILLPSQTLCLACSLSAVLVHITAGMYIKLTSFISSEQQGGLLCS